jgi:hypothetical protein
MNVMVFPSLSYDPEPCIRSSAGCDLCYSVTVQGCRLISSESGNALTLGVIQRSPEVDLHPRTTYKVSKGALHLATPLPSLGSIHRLRSPEHGASLVQ